MPWVEHALPLHGSSVLWISSNWLMGLGIKKTKAPTPTRRMGLICFGMARVNHLYPSGVGFIMDERVFSLDVKVKKLGRRRKTTFHSFPILKAPVAQSEVQVTIDIRVLSPRNTR
jgi:hypothetical protein